MSRKVKHVELLECKETVLLFRLLGRHRAIRELNKAMPSCRFERNSDGKRSIMSNVHWSECKQGSAFWCLLFRLHEQPLSRSRLLGASKCV
jgi:hypothetical protein